jgi:uncharacterized phosphosugar-binding protein
MKGYESFFEGIQLIFDKIRQTEGENIETAAGFIADAVIQDGIVHIFGTGHSNIIAEEVFARANTLAPVNQVVDLSMAGSVNTVRSFYLERIEKAGQMIFDHVRAQPQDVFLVISNSGRNAVPIDFAQAAKGNGHKVIVETCTSFSLSQPSRHPSGKRLLDYADVILDNHTPMADAVVQVEGMKPGLGSASGIAGSLLVHAVLVEAAVKIKEHGVDPPVFMHGNLDGGMEYNQSLLDHYWWRIRNW